MQFDFSEHQRRLYDDARAFGASLHQDKDQLVADDLAGTFDRGIWRRCAAQGLLGLSVPESSGGKGQNNLDTAIALEGFGEGCLDTGLVFALSSQLVSVIDSLLRFGGGEQLANLLRNTVAGDKIGCYAITEAEAGSDCFALEATAVTEGAGDGNGWRLNGHKELITFAPIADYAIVFAATDKNAGSWGISAFVVDCSLDGVTRSDVQAKMGLRTVPIGSISFDNVHLEPWSCLGKPGSGSGIFNATQETERALILAGQVGAMQRQLDQTIEFARGRKQFGQAIGGFQSVSNKIVDMRLQLETCRLLLYKTAWLRDQGASHMLEASLANVHLADSFLKSSLDALMIRGGRGYLTENGRERDVRDAIGGSLYGGTSDIQRQIVARLLGL